jgi:hypothetical protein
MLAHCQVGPRQGRAQIGVGSTPPTPALHQILIVAASVLRAAVVIRIGRHAQRLHGLYECFAQRMAHARLGDDQRTVCSARGGVAADTSLATLEKRQYVVPTPTLRSEVDPIGIVKRLTAHV